MGRDKKKSGSDNTKSKKTKGDNVYSIVEIDVDGDVASPNPDIDHERKIAIYDLLQENYFKLLNGSSGPYVLKISIIEKKLVIDIYDTNANQLAVFLLSLSPFRRIIKDYFMVCESYYMAIKNSSSSKIEAIDMGRRGLHNEGSEILKQRLDGKIEVDLPTARRIFTFICALHWGG